MEKIDVIQTHQEMGGYSYCTLNLSTRTNFFMHVCESPCSEKGGWNGGGSGVYLDKSYTGAGGGGSTDISLYGQERSTNWNNGLVDMGHLWDLNKSRYK